MEASPRDTTLFAALAGGRDGRLVAQLYGVVDSDDPDRIVERLQPFAALGPLVGQQVSLASYADVMRAFVGERSPAQGEPMFRSGLVRSLGGAFASAAAAMVDDGATPWFQIRSMGGATEDLAPDATAFAHRDARFAITAIGGTTRFDEHWARLEQAMDGLYLSFEQRTGEHVTALAFPPATLERLRRVKAEVDPTSLFRDNFPVAPSA